MPAALHKPRAERALASTSRRRVQNPITRTFAFLGCMALLIAISTSSALAQWTTQSPGPTELDVRGTAAPSPQHVFLATDDDSFDDGGALFESTDGGASWVQRDVPESLNDPLNGIFFLDGQNGWTFGNDNYRTTDGGSTWTQMPFLGSTYFMRFYTETFGLATGNFGRYVSRDGGASWEPSPNEMYRFSFSDDLTGLGASDTGLYRTTDGGSTFGSVLAGSAITVAFLSDSVAVGIVDDAFVRSTDGGVTWTSGEPAEGRNRLTMLSSNVVLAWGRSGSFPDYDERVFRSDDGGQTWTDLGEVFGPDVLAFAVADSQTVVGSVRSGDLYRSTDAGATWTQVFDSPGFGPGFSGITAPVFADSQTGYYGFGAGFVIKTTDGGASWNQISSGTGRSLSDIARSPDGDLIAVGESGVVLSSDGTSPWIQLDPFTNFDVEAVQFLSSQEVVAVDEPGRVYRSSDGGATWTAAGSTPGGLTPRDLDFTTLLDGWVAGNGPIGGALFHTTDGGDSWTPVPDFGGSYVATDFEGTNGWAANTSGRYYRSTDEGASWIEEDLPGFPFQIMDMDFYDVSIGYAVGREGYAARSDDGGISWELLPIPPSADRLTDIHLIGPNEIWISSSDDAAYYSATGGQNWAVLEIGSQWGSFSAIAASPEGDAWTVGFLGAIEYFMGPPPPPVNRPPEASFEFETTGLSVDLTDASNDPDGFIVSWAWDFGDSTFSAEPSPSHTYEEEGTYIVRLTVTDDDGDTGSTVRFITVQPLPGGVFGDFTEVTPIDPLFVTPQDEDFWVATTSAADYDGDGDLDMAVLGYYVVYHESVEERLVLIRNDGPVSETEWEFSYIDVPIEGFSSGASDLAWGDVDNDGDQDLAMGTDGQTVIFRNDDGTLVLTDTVLPGYFEDNDQADFDLESISWADYDNDSDLDLLLPSVLSDSTFTYRTALMRNDGPNGSGGWIFTETDSVFAPTGHAQTQWADYDGDLDLDLLVVNQAPLTENGYIRRYRNDGGGVFVGEEILGDLTIEHGEAQWGDYDDDGDLDILVAGHIRELDGTFNRVLRIYRNDAETYVPVEVIECIPCEGWFDVTAASWADYDADGDVDILMTGTYNSGSQIEGRAWIYANEGGVFTDSGNELPAPRASGTRGGSFTWLDLDQDFDLDYFIAGEYFVPGGNGLIEAQMHVYQNNVGGANAAPSGVDGLMADVDGDGGGGGFAATAAGSGATVHLSWDAARDDKTPSTALTYDLDLYKDGVAVATPHRLPQPGSVRSLTEWVVTDLADGSYRWTIRAVDSSFNGGPTAEGTFNVGATSDAPDDVPSFYEVRAYPNPFHRSTSFHFALPTRTDVALDVYDASGRRVVRLVDGTRGAGVHEVSWDAEGVASGTYFARFRTDAFTKTQRILLVK